MFTPISLSDIPGKTRYKLCKVQKDVMDFYESGIEAAEVNIDGYKDAHIASNTYRVAAKRMRVAVVPLARQGRLFLIRGFDNG